MPNVVSRPQASLAIATGALILMTAYCASVIPAAERQRFDLAQDGVMGDIAGAISDLGALEAAVDRYRASPEKAAVADVTRRLGVVRTDLTSLELRGSERIVIDPNGIAALLTLDTLAAELQPLIPSLDHPGVPARMTDLAIRMKASFGYLGTLAFADLNASVSASAASLDVAWKRLIWFAAGSIAGAVLLSWTLFRSSRRLHRLARRDALTGLQNRLTFSETLSALIKDPGPGNEVVLMLLDVDLFKDINDSLGHAAGDLLLKEIARRLGSLVRTGVYLSRLGGDEFALIMTVRHSHRAASDMVSKITEVLAKPADLGGTSATISMSIGVALQSLHLSDAMAMLKNADLALYAAKAAGRGTFRFFNARMDREFRGRREMEADLRKALIEGQFEVHFQPVVDLKTLTIVSCEALLRWKHPSHGYVPPMTFIPLAEDIGLIKEIGGWVLKQACRAAQTWPPHMRIAVNLSPHQFDGDGFVDTFKAVLAETGLAPSRVELEITETLLLRDSHAVLNALAALRALGVQIALDDFGTGYSSLSYLQRFSIDRIKIDQSFVRGMTRSAEATAIVESICLLAAKLDIATTGEGIETEADAALLRAFGCDEGQGYLFDRPMPLAACTARILDQDARRTAA